MRTPAIPKCHTRSRRTATRVRQFFSKSKRHISHMTLCPYHSVAVLPLNLKESRRLQKCEKYSFRFSAHPFFLEVRWPISFSASIEPELSEPAKEVARDFLHDEFDLRSPNLCRHKSHAVHPAAVSLGKPVDSALALAKFQPLD